MLDTYQKDVLYTWRSEFNWELQFVNVALGLAEFGEILAASIFYNGKVDDEAGDFCYYLAMLCNLFELNFADISNNITTKHLAPVGFGAALENYIIAICEIQSIAKKLCFHKKPLEEDIKEVISLFVDFNIGYIKAIAEYKKTTFEEILKLNIEKLKKRHDRKDGEFKFKEATN